MKYSLLLCSNVPLYQDHEGRFLSLDLWVRDLKHQLEVVDRLALVAPVLPVAGQASIEPIPPEIRVIPSTSIGNVGDAIEYCHDYDLAQVGTGNRRKHSIAHHRIATACHRQNKPLITGLSSNRSKAAILNSQNKSFIHRIRAEFVARDILRTQRQLAAQSTGVFLTGQGLKDALKIDHSNIFVGSASWVENKDIVPLEQLRQRHQHEHRALRLYIATRFDAMKGVHLAIQAVHQLQQRLPKGVLLTIRGEGEEYSNLTNLVSSLGLEAVITFEPQVSYPQPFLNTLAEHDLMLITNLSDEQPRILFDAASQGLPSVYPNTHVFGAFDLPSELSYTKGDAQSLADTIGMLVEQDRINQLSEDSLELAAKYTIESMHQKRAEWIHNTVLTENT